MAWYYVPLFVALCLAVSGVAATRTPRGFVWIAGLTASFVVSVAYLKLYQGMEAGTPHAGRALIVREAMTLYRDWLPPSIVAAICDLILGAAIAVFGRKIWETRFLLPIVLGMMLINLITATGLVLGFPPIPGQEFVGIFLEAMNYAALAVVGGTGVLQQMGTWYAERFKPSGVRRVSGNPNRLVGWFLEFGRSLGKESRYKFWGL